MLEQPERSRSRAAVSSGLALHWAAWLAMGMLLFVPLAADSATVSMIPVADTALFENSPNNNLGKETDFPAGTTRNGKRSRGLIRFDLAGQIPINATITSAALMLKVVRAPPGAVSSTFGIHRVLKAWAEGNKTGNTGQFASVNETTWNHRLAPSTPWSAPGASSPEDYASTASGTRFIGGFGSYTFVSTGAAVADLQFWLSNPQSNFGWMLISQSEGTARTARRFGSREISANASVLVVDYTVPPATVQISGTVHFYNGGVPVPGVTVEISGDKTESVTTGSDGAYSFVVDAGGDYSVAPRKTTDESVRRGITTFDIALQRRHILALLTFDSPYEILAADVNDSESVTALDIALIRRVVLAIEDNFPGGAWTFVPSDFEFADATNPWPFERARTYPNLSQDATGQDYVAIKHGDVNGSWRPE